MQVTKPISRKEKAVKGRTLAQEESRAALSMISPTLVVVMAAVVLPIAWLVFIAFRELRLRSLRKEGIFGAGFTLDNIVEAVTGRGFLGALGTTLIYSIVGTLAAVAVGLIAALVVRSPFNGRTLVRGVMLMPYVAPVVAVTFIWSIMLDPNLGIVNELGQQFLGWDRAIPFLSLSGGTALTTVIAYQVWRYFPFAFLFILARLQALPGEVDEAARVDGASPLQRFFYVTLPQLRPVLALLVALRFIWTFNEFDDIYLLTGGGAGTEVITVRAFNFLFGRGDIGAAAALSLVLAASLGILLLVYFKFAVREEKA